MAVPDWLPDWAADVTLGTILAWLLAAAAVIVAFTKIRRALSPLVDMVQALRDFLVEWNGRPAVLDDSGAVKEKAKPGVLVRLGSLEERSKDTGQRVQDLESDVKTIHHEVTPNHGGSIKDQAGRTETKVDGLAAKLQQHIEIAKQSDVEQLAIKEKVSRLDARWGEIPHSQATPPGGLTHIRGEIDDPDS